MLTQYVMLFVGGISTGVLICLLALTLLPTLHPRAAMRARASIPSTSSEAEVARPKSRASVQWIRTLLHWSLLVIALVLTNGLYSSFAIAQTTLQHIDPVVFAAMQLSLLLPFALVILCFTLRSSTRTSVQLGLLGGIPLGVGFVCIAISLHALGIIPTAMLTALDGIVASLVSWLIFHQQMSVYTSLAAMCAGGGAFLLWWIAPSRWQSDLVALSCGILFTMYAFHVERNAVAQGSIRQQILPFLGGLFSSMVATSLVLALCFGHWESVQTMTTTDLETLLYCGLATVLVPQVILTILLRYMSAVTLAFMAVIEPLISIGFAYLWGDISLNLLGWCGVGMILLSILFQAQASRPRTGKKQATTGMSEPEQDSAPGSSVTG